GARAQHRRAMHGRRGRDEGSRGTPAEPKRLMGDVALYRRLLRQARPYWPHFLALFAMGLLASLIALLNPVPLKIVVDSVLGGRPLPSFLHALLPGAATRSPAALPLVGIGPPLAVPAPGQPHGLA